MLENAGFGSGHLSLFFSALENLRLNKKNRRSEVTMQTHNKQYEQRSKTKGITNGNFGKIFAEFFNLLKL